MGTASVNHNVRAEGAGSIAVGGDAINSIFVTGGINQFFVGQYERLADAYLSPRSLYRELHLEEFAGREWLLRAVDDFVASADRGYLVIEAEAGMGKTAFMAWLARKRHYVHHFVRLMPDTGDVGTALRNLSAQLIRAWDLQTLAAGGVLPPNASRRDFFEDVLYEAADTRDATRPGEAIVIVVDGLNETVAPPGQNPLALPANLPAGVYFVVSQRTTHVPLAVATARRVIRITARSPENLADIHAYLEAATAQPKLRQHLTAAGISPDELVERLVVWSSGVWLVLRYVLAELSSGVRSPDNLETLPVGLWQYYARFWVEWQRAHPDLWADADLPLLVTLTALQEPVQLALLCELSGGIDIGRAALLVGDSWRPFLEVQEGPEERYYAYHESLIEFVAGQVDVDTLTVAERSFVRRLVDAQRTAHRRIADRYLTAWGGVAGALPGLQGEAAEMDDGYGLRQLLSHLVRGSADALVHHLMELEWPHDDVIDEIGSSPAANSWYEVHRARRAFANYALDVERAWSYAEQSSAAGPTAPRGLALEFRYALMSASVNSITGNVPGDLLVLLIDHDMVTAAQALDLVRDAPDPRLRSEALAALLARLPAQLRDEAERAALSSAQAVPDGYWRAGEFVRLAATLPDVYLAEIERLADVMSEPYYRRIVRRAVARQRGENREANADRIDQPRAPASSLNPEDPAVFEAQYRERTDKAVATLVAGSRAVAVDDLPAPQRQLAASRFIRDPRWRAQVLVTAAREEPVASRAAILRAALAISMTVGDEAALTAAIRAISVTVARRADFARALACTTELSDPEAYARVLFAIAAAVSASERPVAVRAAFRAAEQVDDVVARRQLLRDHATQLGQLVGAAELAGPTDEESHVTLPPEAHPTWQAEALATDDLAAALRIADAVTALETRIVVLLRIAQLADAPGQALPGARNPVEEARTTLLGVTQSALRSRLVVPVAVALAARERSEAALDLVHGLPDDEARTGALLPLAAHLQPATVGQALALANEIGDPVNRARVLAALTPIVVAGRPTGVQEHVREVLHLLAGSTRAQLLEALPDLLPGLTALAGDQVLIDIAGVVKAVYRWWP